DSQPHVNIQGIEEADEVTVICSLTDPAKVLQLLETANALDQLFAKKKILVIPYLMAARYDRHMVAGDSLDLKVMAGLINSCGFEKVYLYDVHSEVSLVLINNAIAISNELLVKMYDMPEAVLLCPDAGAAKKVEKYFDWNPQIKTIVYCSKNRDLASGKITLEVLEPAECENKNCVIIDDICDGGGTFLAIADQIKPKHLTLIVTHGIFSKGFDELEEHFQQIIVSDSFCKIYDSPIVQTIPFKF
ncbi:MAG: ribose-phosphate pyrophosphokinase-like domain-containing protein, partial [Ferruginibacter sp.]